MVAGNLQDSDLNQMVFLASSEGIMIFESVCDDAGVIVDLLFKNANPAALKIVQRSQDELLGQRLSETFPGNFQTGVFDRYKNSLETNSKTTFDIHYTFEGLDHWFDVSANPVASDLLIVTFVDVSSAKRSAQLLEQREAELRFMLDAMPARVWYKDDENKIIRLNKAAADAMGMPLEKAEGANTYDLFPSIAADYHRDDLIALDGKKPLLGIVERFVPRDGEQGWLTTDKIPFIDPKSDERRLLVVSTDITAQKTAEEELRVSNENLEHFTAIAAHDLQAPLRQIGMFADLLVSEIGEDPAASAAQSYVSQIRSVSSRLRSMINRLLDFSKVGTSKMNLETAELRPIIEAALTQSGFKQSKHATISFELGDCECVLGDTILLTQVFTNLFQNSLKYGPKDDLQLKISSDMHKGFWTIRIWDNGHAIEPAFADRIFEVFSRLSNHSEISGAGIGLAFCRKVMVRHGGSIWLDQECNVGNCFVLTLVPAFEGT